VQEVLEKTEKPENQEKQMIRGVQRGERTGTEVEKLWLPEEEHL
jgi:hypothetical protein